MREMQMRQWAPRELTRISVTGAQDGFIVRNGNEAPVKVTSGRNGLSCQCGKAACAHIESLRMCGFVDDAAERSEAA